MDKTGAVEEDIDLPDFSHQRLDRSVVQHVQPARDNAGYAFQFRKRIGIDVGRIDLGARLCKGQRTCLPNPLPSRRHKRGLSIQSYRHVSSPPFDKQGMVAGINGLRATQLIIFKIECLFGHGHTSGLAASGVAGAALDR